MQQEYFAYVLEDSSGKKYKGVTNNLERRLKEHRSGKTITTSKMSDLKIIYFEKFSTFAEARAREVYFKSSAGRRFLKNKIDTNKKSDIQI